MTYKLSAATLFSTILVVGIAIELIVSDGQLVSGCNLSYVKGTTSGFIEFSLCLAICMPVLLNLFLRLFSQKRHRWWLLIGSVIVLVYMLCIAAILIASKSRASWVAAIVGCAIVGYCHLPDRVRLRLKLWHKLILLLLPFLLAVAFYSIKKDSADGRVLIWKITLREVAAGNVTLLPREDNFSAFLGDAQERYFSSAERSWEEQRLAGAPDYAYNEYLQILVENGIAAFYAVILLLLFIVWLLWKSRERIKVPLAGSFAAVAILAFFSYPLRCPTSLTLVFYILIACVCLAIHKERVRRVSLCVAYIGLAAWFIHKIQTEKKLEHAFDQCQQIEIMYCSTATDTLLRCFQNLYPFLKESPEYLLTYAKALLNMKYYTQCEKVLQQAAHISGDPVFPLLEGKSLQQQKQYRKAERCYLKSYYRVPHRIYPLYLLMHLYVEQGMEYDANDIAGKILSTKPKVPSPEFYQIQDSAKAMLSIRRHRLKDGA